MLFPDVPRWGRNYSLRGVPKSSRETGTSNVWSVPTNPDGIDQELIRFNKTNYLQIHGLHGNMHGSIIHQFVYGEAQTRVPADPGQSTLSVVEIYMCMYIDDIFAIWQLTIFTSLHRKPQPSPPHHQVHSFVVGRWSDLPWHEDLPEGWPARHWAACQAHGHTSVPLVWPHPPLWRIGSGELAMRKLCFTCQEILGVLTIVWACG